jgi:drug/metabolite transporter (DMT)-like permease
MNTDKQEKLGVFLVLLSSLIFSLFPILVNLGSKEMPPLTFAALAALTASVSTFIYMVIRKRIKELKIKKAYFYIFMVTICIVVVPYSLLFLGSSMTSGINTALLLLTEIIFTVIFTHFIGEKTTTYKLLGAGGVFMGAALIVFNGSLEFNLGNILIILSTATYPIGNFYAKKALNYVSPSTILFARYLLGGIFILILSFLFEPESNIVEVLAENWLIILLTGLILLGINKIIWYEALKRLDISKVISLGTTTPAFSLLILVLFFDESITFYQLFGIIFIAGGVYFSIKRKSVDPKLTKYAK